jgi:threonine dehydrogenase-like Zn-dependent dehydrogenase
VVVQIRGVGLCGSDRSIYDGTRRAPSLLWVLGHEGGGDIVAVGSGVIHREIGQRVIIEPNFADGPCAAYLAGHAACDDRR